MERAKVVSNSHSAKETIAEQPADRLSLRLKVVNDNLLENGAILGCTKRSNGLMTREKNVFVFDPEHAFQVTNPPTFSNN